jgi:chromosome segregation ATPase
MKTIARLIKIGEALIPAFSEPKKMKAIVEGIEDIEALVQTADKVQADLSEALDLNVKNQELLEKLKAENDKAKTLAAEKEEFYAEVETHKNKVAQYNKDVSALEKDRSKLADDIASLEDEKAEVAGLKTAAKEELAEAKKAREELRAKADALSKI